MTTRIVTTHYRYKRPPRKRAKAVDLEVPAIVAEKSSRRPADSQMAAEVISRAPHGGGASKPITRADVTRDRTVTGGEKPGPANDDRKPAIVTAQRPRKRYVDVPDLTPEEHRRRGDAADAIRAVTRRIKRRP